MSEPTKFMFETVFGDSGEIVKEAPPPPKKIYRPDEVDVIRAEAHQEGSDNAVAAALSLVAAGFQTIMQTLEAEIEQTKAEAARLSYAMATKIADRALEDQPTEMIEAIVSDCVDFLRSEPIIHVSVSPEHSDALGQKLTALVAERGYEGRLMVTADEQATPGDCRIEWMNGSFARDAATIKASIAKVIEHHWPGIELKDLEESNLPQTDEPNQPDGPNDHDTNVA